MQRKDQELSSITITFMDIIQGPFFYLKRDVSETGLHLRLQVEPNQFGA
jgi:hypothetical protein